jgi:hypothetical protein
LTRARLPCAGLLVAAVTADGLVAAPPTLSVVGDHAAHHHTALALIPIDHDYGPPLGLPVGGRRRV